MMPMMVLMMISVMVNEEDVRVKKQQQPQYHVVFKCGVCVWEYETKFVLNWSRDYLMIRWV